MANKPTKLTAKPNNDITLMMNETIIRRLKRRKKNE